MKTNKSFLIVLLLIFFNSGGLMLPILATLFFNDLKFNVEIIGIVMSFFGIGGLVGGYIGGHLADYIHSKKIVSVSLLGNGIFIMLFSLIKQDVLLFSICMLFIGFFNSSFRPSSLLLLFETKGRFSESKVLSYRRVVNSMGFAIASFGFGLLYHVSGKWAFFVIGLLFIFTFFLSLILKESKIHATEKKEKEVQRKPNLKLFMTLNVFSVLFIIVFNQYSTTYTLFLENFAGFSLLDISTLFTIHGIIIVLFQIPVGHFSDKITLSMGCFIGSILLAFGMGLTGFASNFALAIFFCTLWTFAEMILPPLTLPFILKTSIYKRGKTMGIYQTSFSSGVFLAPLLGSFFYKISPYFLWNLCFAVSIICALFFLALYIFYEPKVGTDHKAK
jgi:MFS family permease